MHGTASVCAYSSLKHILNAHQSFYSLPTINYENANILHEHGKSLQEQLDILFTRKRRKVIVAIRYQFSYIEGEKRAHSI